MFRSHRQARVSAPFAVVLILGGLSCARGSPNVDATPFGMAGPVASSQGDTFDAAAPSAPNGALSDDATYDDGASTVSVPAGDVDEDADVDAGDIAAYLDTTDAASNLPGDSAVQVPPSAGPYAAAEPGDLAITEVMLSPSGPEPESEWFEIYNRASAPRLLSGLTIEDGYGDTHVITSTAPLIVPAAAYVLLVRDEAVAAQALVPPSPIVYAYGSGLAWYEGIELDDGDAGDLSLWSGSRLLVDVPYGMWDASWIGQSIELATPDSDATDPGQWCIAQSPWASGSDDGTPGAASDCGP